MALAPPPGCSVPDAHLCPQRRAEQIMAMPGVPAGVARVLRVRVRRKAALIESPQLDATVVEEDAIEPHRLAGAQILEARLIGLARIVRHRHRERLVITDVDREQSVRTIDLAHGALERLHRPLP